MMQDDDAGGMMVMVIVRMLVKRDVSVDTPNNNCNNSDSYGRYLEVKVLSAMMVTGFVMMMI